MKMSALVVAVLASGCSASLNFELDPPPRCWCGEEWQGQVSGAFALNANSVPYPIPQTATTHSLCVSQRQHIALNDGDSILTDSLAAGSVVRCQDEAAAILGGMLSSTTCAEEGGAVVHVGACWEADNGLLCPLLNECRGKYDCDPEPVWEDWGGETGGVIEPDECPDV